MLIFYGAGNELWLRRKLREVQKSAGYGRKPPHAGGRHLRGPADVPAKARFRTHEADDPEPARWLRAEIRCVRSSERMKDGGGTRKG